MKVTVTIELNKTEVDVQELEDRLRYLWESSLSKDLCGFNLLLMKMSKASTWELRELKVSE